MLLSTAFVNSSRRTSGIIRPSLLYMSGVRNDHQCCGSASIWVFMSSNLSSSASKALAISALFFFIIYSPISSWYLRNVSFTQLLIKIFTTLKPFPRQIILKVNRSVYFFSVAPSCKIPLPLWNVLASLIEIKHWL